jgi:hypothetical protein
MESLAAAFDVYGTYLGFRLELSEFPFDEYSIHRKDPSNGFPVFLVNIL